MVQLYPWFKFSFLLFQTHYHIIIIHYHTQKQKKRKFEPRIKLNHNIYIIFNFFIESKSTVTETRGFTSYPFNCQSRHQYINDHLAIRRVRGICCGRQNVVQFSYYIHSCTRVTLRCQLNDSTIELNCRRLRVLVFNSKATFTLNDPT